MNSVERFFRHYVLSTIGILILFVCVNLALLAGFFAFAYTSKATEGTFPTEEFSAHIAEGESGPEADAEAMDMLRAADAWAMILNDSGLVIWEENLPDELPRSYTMTDVALFSRWYLEDYPVRIWKRAEGLLVVGFQPGSVLQLYLSFKFNYWGLLLAGTVGTIIVNLLLMMFLFLRNAHRLEPGLKRNTRALHWQNFSFRGKRRTCGNQRQLKSGRGIPDKERQHPRGLDQGRIT